MSVSDDIVHALKENKTSFPLKYVHFKLGKNLKENKTKPKSLRQFSLVSGYFWPRGTQDQTVSGALQGPSPSALYC